MQAVQLEPVSPGDQRQRPFDLFLIFAGANIVATTLQVGATLADSLGLALAMAVIAVGAVGGALLVAALAPLGPRLRVPSIVACRAALGFSGAQLLAWLLVVTNFGWIALNNVIAASICATLAGGPASVRAWVAKATRWPLPTTRAACAASKDYASSMRRYFRWYHVPTPTSPP